MGFEANIKHTEKKSGIHSGISILLMLLVVLAMATFGLLSLSSARVDSLLTDRAVKHIDDFYKAESAAATTLSVIDARLVALAPRCKDSNELAALTASVLPLDELHVDGNLITFLTPVDTTQALLTQVTVNDIDSFSTDTDENADSQKQRFSTSSRLIHLADLDFIDGEHMVIWND